MTMIEPPSTTIPQAIVDQTLLDGSYVEAEGQPALTAQTPSGNEAIEAACIPSGCYATIQAAVSAARSGDTVNVAAGLYVETVQMRSGISVVGAGASTTTIRAPAGATRVISFPGATTSSTVLSNLTIDGNNIAGGITVGAGTPTIRNNIIINGRSSYGGAILISNSGTAPTITANEFRNNVATISGGAMLIQSSSRPIISSNTFISNSAPQQGGAIIVSSSAAPTISGNTFRTNTAMQGGAVAASGSAIWTFSENQVISNTVTGSQSSGGGLYIFKSGVSIVGNTFNGNQAGVDAGAIIMNNGGTTPVFIDPSVIVADNTFTNNRASRSAGALFLVTGASPTIRNNTFRSNQTSTEGGGAINYVDRANGILENNLIENNNAAFGGGLYIDGFSNPTVQNNRILNNRAGSAAGVQINNNSNPTFVNNLVSGNVATTQVGGLWISVNCAPLISGNTFSNNQGVAMGGGVAILTSSGTVMINNTITGNTANTGGGLYINQSSPTIHRNTIATNTATVSGGGVTYSTSGGIFENNVVAGNSVPVGGSGIALYRGTPTIQYNTIVDNTLSEGINAWTNVTDPSATAIVRANHIVGHSVGLRSAGNARLTSNYNLYWNNTVNAVGVTTGANDQTQDPRFRSRPTRDYTLAAGSPAIDRGDPANVPTVDNLGTPRPIDGDNLNGAQPDVGAFEARACPDVLAPTGIGIEDIQAVASRWQSSTGQTTYNSRYDVDQDGTITLFDVVIVAEQWDRPCA